MSKLNISWKCTTMARIGLLEETLFSFLNQKNLQDCEMVIVNDYPLQTLIFEHPNVRIFNIKEPFKTIGEKENFTVEQCKGEIIAVTDDDDVYLSNHNDNIIKYFVPGTDIMHWYGIYYNQPEISDIIFIGNSGMVYSKEAWLKVGKHPIMNGGGDTVFADKIHAIGNTIFANPPDDEKSAFYRWKVLDSQCVGVYHQSGQGFDVEGKPNVIQRHAHHIEQLRKEGYIPTGDIVLKPKWRIDYEQLLKKYLKNNKNGTS